MFKMSFLNSGNDIVVKCEQLDEEGRTFIQRIEAVETTLLNLSGETSNLSQHNVIVKTEQLDNEERIFIKTKEIDETTSSKQSDETNLKKCFLKNI